MFRSTTILLLLALLAAAGFFMYKKGYLPLDMLQQETAEVK